MPTREPPKTIQIKVTLAAVKPPVWRRILVSEKITLLDLHDVIQSAFGWQDYHLHEFKIRNTSYGDPQNDDTGLYPLIDEAHVTLKELKLSEGEQFTYIYDFGDDWHHTLQVEKILPHEKGQRLPVCLAGKRACPPEDVGGPSGYRIFLEALHDPDHPEHESFLEWIGGSFDAEQFDLKITNAFIAQINQDGGFDSTDESELLRKQIREFISEPRRLKNIQTAENEAYAKALPLRNDVIALITYLRDNKVTGTQATGNFPRKAIYAIGPLFTKPPILDTVFDTIVISFQNEYEVWPIYFLHVLTEVSGLISGGRGRLWRLTEAGKAFLDAPAVVQVWTLLAFWWYRINWLIASPYDLFGDFLPEAFAPHVMALLHEIRPGMQVKIDAFVNHLKINTGWNPIMPDVYNPAKKYKDAIEDMVVRPLEGFGILNVQYKTETVHNHKFDVISSFQISPFGQAMLEALRQ